MSYKALELQVALPRTFEAAKMLSDIEQRGMVAQSQLTNQLASEEARKRKHIESTKKKQMANFTANHDQKNASHSSLFSKHPYKGNKIDLLR